MTLTVTCYSSPKGKASQVEITNITDADAAWFKDNNVKVSMETLSTGQHAVYADIGKTMEDGTPVECIEISWGRTYFEVMSALRKQCEDLKTSEVNHE